jgi:uncharacterized protein YjdB
MAALILTFNLVLAGCDNPAGSDDDDDDTPADPIAVSGVSLDKATSDLGTGKEFKLTATITPDDATNKAVSWESSNTSVATINGGVVTGVAAGTATITVTTADGNKNVSGSKTKGVGMAINGFTYDDIGKTITISDGNFTVVWENVEEAAVMFGKSETIDDFLIKKGCKRYWGYT